jgi:hypothetical protein
MPARAAFKVPSLTGLLTQKHACYGRDLRQLPIPLHILCFILEWSTVHDSLIREKLCCSMNACHSRDTVAKLAKLPSRTMIRISAGKSCQDMLQGVVAGVLGFMFCNDSRAKGCSCQLILVLAVVERKGAGKGSGWSSEEVGEWDWAHGFLYLVDKCQWFSWRAL